MHKIEKYREEVEVIFSNKDSETMVNVTKIAKHFGKQPKHWLENEQTKQLIKAIFNGRNSDLLENLNEIPDNVVTTVKGRLGGTYIHKDLFLAFAQWLSVDFYLWANKVILKVMNDGYFISEQAKDNPSKELIEDISEISKTRQALYHKRNELMSVIVKFLYGDEWQEHSMATQMSRLHQYCHVALTLNTAQGVIESKIRANKDKQVVLHSYLKMNDREPNRADYLVALNYYNDEDLKLYLSYFNTALERVVHHIKARHLTPTTQSVIKMLNEIGRDVVKTSTNLDIGNSIQTKNRKNFNIILNQLTDGSLSHEEFLEECEELTLGKDFVI